MPPIRYDDLKKTFDEFEKSLKGKPADPVRDELYMSIKQLCDDIHPLNRLTETANLTTSEQRRAFYGDVQEYLNILSDPQKFDSSTKSKKASVKDLDELNRVGASIQNKLGDISNVPKFADASTKIFAGIGSVNRELSQQVKQNDIDRYLDNTLKAAQTASAKTENVVTDTASTLLTEVDSFARNVDGYPDDILNLDQKREFIRTASILSTFYADNVLGSKKDDLLADQQKSEELNRDMNDLKKTAEELHKQIAAKNPDYAENFKNHINDITEKINNDWTMRTGNAAFEMAAEMKQQRADEEQKIAEQIQGDHIEEVKLTPERRAFEERYNREPMQYDQLPFLQNMRDILDIDTESPEIKGKTVTFKDRSGKSVTRNLEDEIRDLKGKAMNVLNETSSHYIRAGEEVKLLNKKEMDSLDNTINEFKIQCGRIKSTLRNGGDLLPEVADTIDAAREGVTTTAFALETASEYIDNYGNEGDPEKGIRSDAEKGIFSMYEIQGKMNPTAGSNYLQSTEWLNNVVGPHFEEAMKGERIDRNGKPVPVRGDHKKVAESLVKQQKEIRDQLDKLNNKQLKPLFKQNEEFGIINPLKEEQVRKLSAEYSETERKLAGFIKTYEDHHFQKDSKGAIKLDPKTNQPLIKGNGPYDAERELYESVKDIHSKIADKSRLLGYLCGQNGNALTGKVEDFQKLPQAEKNAAKEAEFLNYVIGCKAHLKSGTLLPQYLLDDHKAPRVSTVLGMMDSKVKIDQNNKLEQELTNTKWVNGKRSLDHIKDFHTKQLQQGNHDEVYQFAENNKEKNMENFEKIVEETVLKYTFHDNNVVKYTDKNEIEHKFCITDKLDAYQHQMLTKKLENGKLETNEFDNPIHSIDPAKTFAPLNDGTFDGGFKNAFTEDEIKAGGDFLKKVVTELNRNMYNAGLAKDAILKNGEQPVPEGYNEGYAREFVSELTKSEQFGQMYPKVSMYDEKNKLHIPHANGKGNKDKTTPILLGSVQKNYNRGFEKHQQGLLNEKWQPKYYTTPKNFRSCTFVRDMPIDKNQKLEFDEAAMAKYFQGKGGGQIDDQINTFTENIKKKKINVKADWADPFTTSVRDYKTFYKPEMIKNAADLQAMDYIFGIPKRGTDDIRIDFQTSEPEPGHPIVNVVGISGANSEDKLPLVSDSIADNSKLFDPKKMLVVSQSMADKIEWFANFNKNNLTPKEKEIVKHIPEENLTMMTARAIELDTLIKASKKEKFNDLRDEKNNLIPGGLVTKPGFIRVIPDDQFKNLNLDTLTMGMNGDADFNDADYTKRYEMPPQNMFDTLAAMPKACHDALKDKEKVFWVPEPNFERGTQYDEADLIMKGHKAHVDQVRDMQFNMLESEHLLEKSINMGKEQAAMYEDRSNEKLWHKIRGDSKEFLDVCDALYELETEASMTKLRREQEEAMEVLGREGFIAAINKKGKNGEDAYNENKRILSENQKERWQKYQKLCADKGVFVPKKRPPYDKDPSVFINVMEKNADVCTKIEKYLEANPKPSSKLGIARRDHMMKIYNKINHQMKEYAYLTGITSHPIRSCSIGEDGKVKFNNVYKSRYDFETQGVHPIIQEEYKKPYLTSNESDRIKAEEFKKQVDEFNKKREQTYGNNEAERRAATSYAIPNSKQGRAYNPSMNGRYIDLDIKPKKNEDAPKQEAPKKNDNPMIKH